MRGRLLNSGLSRGFATDPIQEILSVGSCPNK
jgi:hypothetical protein